MIGIERTKRVWFDKNVTIYLSLIIERLDKQRNICFIWIDLIQE